MKYNLALTLFILTPAPYDSYQTTEVCHMYYSGCFATHVPTLELFRSHDNITCFKQLYTYCVYIFLFKLRNYLLLNGFTVLQSSFTIPYNKIHCTTPGRPIRYMHINHNRYSYCSKVTSELCKSMFTF